MCDGNSAISLCLNQLLIFLFVVWDLESNITMSKKDDSYLAVNASTMNTTKSEHSAASVSSNDTDKSM